MLSMMPDLLGQANQRQTTRRGWRCGGPRPGWQLNQAHDLCQTISRICCSTPSEFIEVGSFTPQNTRRSAVQRALAE